MSNTTVVTGASGFAGGHLLDHLGSRRQLVAWYRPGGRTPDRTRGTAWDAVDLVSRTSVVDAVQARRPSHIFHLAGAANVATSWTDVTHHLRTNVLGLHHLLEAVRTTGLRCRILVVSSGQVYRASPEPLTEDSPLLPATPYGFSKLAEDQLAQRSVREDGFDLVIARPFNHSGPGQGPGYALSSFARQIARAERGLGAPVLSVGNLDAERDVTDVRDVAAAYEGLMQAGRAGTPYNICSERPRRIGDLLEELLRLAKVSVRLEVAAARLRPLDIPTIHGSASRIRTEIGWTPRIPIERTLRDTLDWWRARVATESETG
jgi:GDP-4-dehydro-6-deoxy-D-mannose reductase